jgi:hypothetical protein
MKTEIILGTIGLIIAVIIAAAMWAKAVADEEKNGYQRDDYEDDCYGEDIF